MATMEYPGNCELCIHINENEDDPNTPCGQCLHSHIVNTDRYSNMYEEKLPVNADHTVDRLLIHGAICDEIKNLYKRKNADYGDSFSRARKEVPFYTLGKLYDKFSRYKNLTINGEQSALVDESLDDTLMDMANYCIMELMERQYERGKGRR